jgi:hypothetical protein
MDSKKKSKKSNEEKSYAQHRKKEEEEEEDDDTTSDGGSTTTTNTTATTACETDCKQPSWADVQDFAIRRCMKIGNAAAPLPASPCNGCCKIGEKVLSSIMKDPSGGANAVCNFWNQDCQMTSWSKWSGCSIPRCDAQQNPKGGFKKRTRTIKEPSKGLGRPCNTFVKEQKLPCNSTKDLLYTIGSHNLKLGTIVSPTQFVLFEKNKFAQLNTMNTIQGKMHDVGPIRPLKLMPDNSFSSTDAIQAFTFEALVYIPGPQSSYGSSQNKHEIPLWSHQTVTIPSGGGKMKSGTSQNAVASISIKNPGTSNVQVCVIPPTLHKGSPFTITALSAASHYHTYQCRHGGGGEANNSTTTCTKTQGSSKNYDPPPLKSVVTTNKWFHIACRADQNPPENTNKGTPYIQVFINGHASKFHSVSNGQKARPHNDGKHYLGTLMKPDGTPTVSQDNNPPSCFMYNVRVWSTSRTSDAIQTQASIYMDAGAFQSDGISNEIPFAIAPGETPSKHSSLPDVAQKCNVNFFQTKPSDTTTTTTTNNNKYTIVAPTFAVPDKDTRTIPSSYPHVPKGTGTSQKDETAKISKSLFGYLTTYVHLADCHPRDCQISCQDSGKVSDCSAPCGGGVRMKQCKITQYPCDGGKPCPTDPQCYYKYEPCNQQPCKDCQLEPMQHFWERCRANPKCWSPCSAPCNGTQYAYRMQYQSAGPNGKPCSQHDRKVSRPCCAQCQCNVCPVGSKNDVCSGKFQGKCVPPSQDKHFSKGHCVCQPGYAGRACGLQCPRGWSGKTCSGNGTCQVGVSVRNFFDAPSASGSDLPVAIQLFDTSNSNSFSPDVSHTDTAEQLTHLQPRITTSSNSAKKPHGSSESLFGESSLIVPTKNANLQSLRVTPSVNGGDNVLGQSITVSLWFMLHPNNNGNATTAVSKGQTILWRLYSPDHTGNDDDHDCRLGFDMSQNKVWGQKRSSASTSEPLQSRLVPGTWHQWAATFDYPHKCWQVYLDGRPLLSQKQSLHENDWWTETVDEETTSYASTVADTTQESKHVPFLLDGYVLFFHGSENSPLSDVQIRQLYATQRSLVMGRFYPPNVNTPPSMFMSFNTIVAASTSNSQGALVRPLFAESKFFDDLFTFPSVESPSSSSSQIFPDTEPIVSAKAAFGIQGPFAGKNTRAHHHNSSGAFPSLTNFFCHSFACFAWVKRTTSPSASASASASSSAILNGIITVISIQRHQSVTPADLRIQLDAKNDRLWLQGGPGANPEEQRSLPLDIAALFSTAGEWHQIGFFFNHVEQSIQAYVDGSPQGNPQSAHPAPWWCDQGSHPYVVTFGKVTSSTDIIAIDGVQLLYNQSLTNNQMEGVYNLQKDVKQQSATHHMRATTLCKCLPGFRGRACEKGGKCLVVQALSDGDKQPKALFDIDDQNFSQAQCEMMGIATQTHPNARWPPKKGNTTPFIMYKSVGEMIFSRVVLQSLSMPHMFYWMPESILQWMQSDAFLQQLPETFLQLYSISPGTVLKGKTFKNLNDSQAYQFIPLLFSAFTANINQLTEWQWLELSSLLNLQVNCGSIHQPLGPPSQRRDGFVFQSTGWTYVKDLGQQSSLNDEQLYELWQEYAAVHGYRGCIRTPYKDPTTGKQLYTGQRPSNDNNKTVPVTRMSKMVFVGFEGSQKTCSNGPQKTHNDYYQKRFPSLESGSLLYQLTGTTPLKGPQVIDIAYPVYGGMYGEVVSGATTLRGVQALAKRFGNRDRCYHRPGTVYPSSWSFTTRQSLLQVVREAKNSSEIGSDRKKRATKQKKNDNDKTDYQFNEDNGGGNNNTSATLQEALRLGTNTTKKPFPSLNGTYPQSLADSLNAQCPGFRGRCRPIMDDNARKALCGINTNQTFSAYMYLTSAEAKQYNAQGPRNNTGWYYVPKTTVQQGPCQDVKGKCADLSSCRTRLQLGSRLVHLSAPDTSHLTDFPSSIQCPGGGGTIRDTEPCLGSTANVWWNYWSETTKQKWIHMLTSVGAKTSKNEPDWQAFVRGATGNIVPNDLIRRLNSQCDPGNRCQIMNGNTDAYIFKQWESGGQFYWKHVNNAAKKFSSLCGSTNSARVQNQAYCYKVRDWMCPLGLVYTGNLYGGCYCPLSSSETPTRTEQRMLSTSSVKQSLFAGRFQYDVQWAELDQRNRLMKLCNESASKNEWKDQRYYLSFSSFRTGSPKGYVAFRNNVDITDTATIVIWAQTPSSSFLKRFANLSEVGLWYLSGCAGTTSGCSRIPSSTSLKSSYGIGLLYNIDDASLRLTYGGNGGETCTFQNSGQLHSDTQFYHIAIRIQPSSSSSSGKSQVSLFVNGECKDTQTFAQTIYVGGETQGLTPKQIDQAKERSALGRGKYSGSTYFVGGLYGFRVYKDALPQKSIRKDMCSQRSPQTTAGLVLAFQFIGGGDQIPNAGELGNEANQKGGIVLNKDKNLACPAGYVFKQVQSKGQTYQLCHRELKN